MADYRDLMHARSAADTARDDLARLAGALEDADRTDNGLGQLLGLEAVCLELRALGVTIDHMLGELIQATGGV